MRIIIETDNDSTTVDSSVVDALDTAVETIDGGEPDEELLAFFSEE